MANRLEFQLKAKARKTKGNPKAWSSLEHRFFGHSRSVAQGARHIFIVVEKVGIDPATNRLGDGVKKFRVEFFPSPMMHGCND